MPQRQHSHTNRPLNRRRPPRTARLPVNRFGALSGSLNHLTLNPHDGPRPDDNHVYLWIEVGAGRFAGKYECAFNTESSNGGSQTEFAVVDETITLGDFPTEGFADAEVSYKGLGLKQSEFLRIANGALRSSVIEWTHECNSLTAYGITYGGGDGLHDIHMNSGERPGSHHPNQTNHDGALVFYFRNEGEEPYRRWVFIKFSTQDLH